MDSITLKAADRDWIFGNLRTATDAARELKRSGADSDKCDRVAKAADGIYHFLREEWNRQAATRD